MGLRYHEIAEAENRVRFGHSAPLREFLDDFGRPRPTNGPRYLGCGVFVLRLAA